MIEFINAKQIPDALICSNDLMALGVLAVAKKSGIKIPEQMSLIGFDDIGITELTDPPLSTVKQPLFDMGFAASEILFKKINNPETKSVCKIFPVEMITRKSVK